MYAVSFADPTHRWDRLPRHLLARILAHVVQDTACELKEKTVCWLWRWVMEENGWRPKGDRRTAELLKMVGGPDIQPSAPSLCRRSANVAVSMQISWSKW
jgi:hypothetical protein